MNDIIQIIRGQVTDDNGQMIMADIRIWTGYVMSNTSGNWSVDISKASMSEVMHVVATSQSNVTAVNDVPVASVRSYTTEAVHGYVIQGNVLGLGMRKSPTITRVFVQVYGV